MGSECVVCGSLMVAGPLSVDSGVYLPDSSAAAVVTSLNVEPGGYRLPEMVRLTIGCVESALSCFHMLTTDVVSCEARVDGSYVGELTMARTAPVLGSSATAAPRRLPSAFAAAAWILGLIVSSTLAPAGFLPVTTSARRR